MGLFGALFAGVSGLDAQSNKIGIISNNISNVNTIGYKEAEASFDSLVVPSGTTGTFSPGGVLGQTQQLVTQQGLIQGTSSGTDVAISGNGFFVVNSASKGTGQSLLTRSGSFTQDALGNFINSNGDFLQAWPLDANGHVPTNSANFTSLKTVNISSNASGAAVATTDLTLAANLNSSQKVLLGAGETAKPTGNNNISITATDLLVGNDIAGDNSTNGIKRGDSFTVATGGSSTLDKFTYGGFAIGRNITLSNSTGEGDGGNLLLTGNGEVIAGTALTTGTTGQITLSVPDAVNYVNSKSIFLSGFGATSVGGIPAADINGSRQVLSVNTGAGTITVQSGVSTSTAATGNSSDGLDATNRSYNFAGNMLDASNATNLFLGTSGVSAFTTASQSFTITTTGTSGGTTSTFTYTGASPNTSEGQFNNLTTLAQAINNTAGLTARLVDNRLYVGSANADQGLTFANEDATGNGTLAGINWTQELDLKNYSAAASGVNQFNSLTSLASAVNSTTDLTATINNPLGASTLSINENNPEVTAKFSDATGNAGSLLQEFGFTSAGGGALTTVSGVLTTGILPPTYNPSNYTSNMSSGAITPQFSRDITVFDSLGDSHTLAFNFAKISTNTWAVEVTAVPASDVLTSSDGSNLVLNKNDGQLVSGTVTFKGDGSLGGISPSLASTFSAPWSNGSNSSTLSLNLGTLGSTNGLSQFSSAFNVTEASQNGSSVGELTGVNIDGNGFVIATFSNGQTQKLYQVPLALVNNPDGLNSVSGDAFEQTQTSGVANLSAVGANGAGTLSTSSLEQSNVDLSSQLTNLIVAQQAYDANTKVLSISGQLLQQLNQIIQ